MSTEQLPVEYIWPATTKPIIKVVGVGGGGSNAVNHMYNQDIRDVSFVVCNTDNQALSKSPVPCQVQLGANTTKGLGAGNRPEVAQDAARESREKIIEMLNDNTQMVFITAGMGGGTGTGAAPVIAEIAQELGILTIGIVTIPFAFEGRRKIVQALEGVKRMSKHTDAILVINNEKLCEIYPDFELANAFSKADDILTTAARGIAEIITIDGYINVDFNDVNTILRGGGVAIMNTGEAYGDHRINEAIHNALESPLLNNKDIYSAKRILFNFYCSRSAQIRLDEVNEITSFMEQMADEDIEVIWGITFDDTLGEMVKVTLLASGFKESVLPVDNLPEKEVVLEKPIVSHEASQTVSGHVAPGVSQSTMDILYPTRKKQPISTEFDLGDLENEEILQTAENVPSFLRLKK